MTAWTDDRGRLSDRLATIVPRELHQAIADAAEHAIRNGVPAALLDARVAARSGTLIGFGPDRRMARIAHLEEQITDAQRRATNARRNANLVDDAEIAAELLADAAGAKRDEQRLVEERATLIDNREILAEDFGSEADYLAHALARLAAIEHDIDGSVADALAQVIEISRMVPDERTVHVQFYLRVPADGRVARLGPIRCEVPNRAYRSTLADAVPAHVTRHRLVRAALRNGLADGLRRRNEHTVVHLVTDALVTSGYSPLAAKIAVRASTPSLHAVIAHDLWGEPLPPGIDTGYVTLVLVTYKDPAFGWNPRYHAVDATDRQRLVDIVTAAGGRLDMTQLDRQLGKRDAQVIRVYSRPQQLGAAPTWPPCLHRGGRWSQGRRRPGEERYLQLVACPHCSGHATVVVRTPETPAGLLCPQCRRMPTPTSPMFPNDYFASSPDGPRTSPAVTHHRCG